MAYKFERVAGPFQGPANGVIWYDNQLVVSLMEDQRLVGFDPKSKTVTELRKYTGRVNGLAIGKNGELFGCQDGGRRLVEFAPDGRMFKVDALIDGKLHNHPTSVVVDKAGRIWFSDPYSEILAFGPQIFPKLDHASVLRLEKDDRNAWAMRRVTTDTVAPRAVLLSADEKTLYVSEGDAKSKVRELRAYTLEADGTASSHIVLLAFGADHRGLQRGIEGLCRAPNGDMIAVGGSAKSGPGPLVYVFGADNLLKAAHPFPGETPNHCCFGGDGKTLYVTTQEGGLYAGT